ncbi:MAG: transposase [Cyanobacteria bacterium P01_G01_bin.19]
MPKIIRTDKWALLPDEYQLPILNDTVTIYRDMVRRLISVVNLRWKEIAVVEAQQRYVEQLFHATKDNPNPKFGKFFGAGTRLYKFPSYLRRAAINDAIGHVSSFHTRYRDWQTGMRKRKTAKPPGLNTSCGVYPDLYKNQCIKVAADYRSVEIKAYKNNDWAWETVKISSLARRHLIPGVKQLSPTLVVKNGSASLSVPYWIPKAKANETNKYCGVDLGINTTAVCSIVDEAGLVHARKFIHDGKSLDKRDKHLARISKKARLTKKLHKGFAKLHYRKAANISKNIANQAAKQIINFAITNNATTVVTENLRNWKPKGGKRKSSLKQRFHGWVKSAIADRLEQLGQEHGIKIVSVYARGTSSTAYDGTGKVKRDKDNYALGSFSTGKRYAIDLSASYNIAAKYIAHKLKLATKGGKLLVSQSSDSKPRSWASLSTLWSKTYDNDKPDTTTTALSA